MCSTWVWGPHWQVVLEKRPKVLKLQIGERTKVVSSRAGNSFIGFPSESLVFSEKMSA